MKQSMEVPLNILAGVLAASLAGLAVWHFAEGTVLRHTVHMPRQRQEFIRHNTKLAANVPQGLSLQRVQNPTVSTPPVASQSTWAGSFHDQPLKNGPNPLYLKAPSGQVYRAIHYIAKWDPSVQSWEPISPDLTQDNQVGSPGYGIDGITAAAEQGGTWYVGTLTGGVEVKQPGRAWSQTVSILPERTVSAAAIDPAEASGAVAVIGFAGYSAATPEAPGHVYATLDFGKHWSDITGNLPDRPVQSVRFVFSGQKSLLQVKENGQWYTMEGKGKWKGVYAAATHR
ncbi:hypothetical protein LLE49_11255 [Alicyclobacillus tolerans]|uniref:hypothetical protein n=1 Tax=Alicyclobacillus tolerans TaxID=90970 RepID=UPI001F47782B|nr:hypothetical protein [Alicyclobacillus tolerans]MCF8565293.1 hypothetical protein [Alicyclobacillus tolerans]